MTIKSQLGKLGEDLASEYLVNNKYKIIERNFRRPWGEVDIIAMAPDRTLVFVEVKTMAGHDNDNDNKNNYDDDYDELKPEDQLTKAKLRKLQKTASLYAGHNSKFINERMGWRIDLLSLTINGESCDIKHYENI